MFTTSEKDGLLYIEIGGQIDAKAMREGLDAFLAMAESRDKVRCVYTITDIEIPPLDAIMVEFGYFGRLFQLLRKLDRVALVANQDWVRNAAALESLMIPGLEMRNYPNADAAMEWLHG